MSLAPVQAQRRYVGLTALRWLPVGLTTPITVLLAQARGRLIAVTDANERLLGVITAATPRDRARSRPEPQEAVDA